MAADRTLRTAPIIGRRTFGGRTAVEVRCPWCRRGATHWLIAQPGTVAACLDGLNRPFLVTETSTV